MRRMLARVQVFSPLNDDDFAAKLLHMTDLFLGIMLAGETD